MPKTNSTSTQSLASAALAYAKAGWYVFPLAPGQKIPRKHSKGVLEATNDISQVKRWWSKSPDSNIGIAVKRSGLGLIDLDMKPEKGKNGIAALAKMLLADGELGQVATQTTPSGGRHHVFKRRGPLIDRVDWNGKPGGIDIMTKGHRYFVAEPSVVNGKMYTWDGPAPWTRVGKLSPIWAATLRDDSAQPDSPLLGRSGGAKTATDTLLDSAALRVPGVTMEELESILDVLDPSMPRDPWLRVLWGAAAQWAGTKAEPAVIVALDDWSRRTDVDGQYREGEVEKRWKEHTSRAGGKSGVGHVTWRGVRAMAREAGWSPFSLGGVDPKDWKRHLHTKKIEVGGEEKTVVVSDAWNSSLFMSYHKDYAGGVRRNVLTNAIELHKPELAPLRDPTRLPGIYNPKCDWIGVGSVLKEKMVGQPLGRDSVNAAVEAAATVHSFDPMRDWIDGLAWDGKPRIDTWLTRVCGVNDTPLHRAYARKWLIGLAGRASAEYDGRGVKMDSVLVLQGYEGVGKSTVGSILGGEWFAEFSNSLAGEEVYYTIEKSMVLEFPELDAMNRTDASRIKALVTSQADTFRRKYDPSAATRPRRCVFIGTVNDETFLTRDMTMRRWWIVRCPSRMFDLKWLRENRDQLIAEAKAAWDKGEIPVLPRDVHEAQSANVEGARMVHPYEEAIQSWIDSIRNSKSESFRIGECVEGALGRNIASLSMFELRKFGECLRNAGMEKRMIRPDGAKGGRTAVWSVSRPGLLGS